MREPCHAPTVRASHVCICMSSHSWSRLAWMRWEESFVAAAGDPRLVWCLFASMLCGTCQPETHTHTMTCWDTVTLYVSMFVLKSQPLWPCSQRIYWIISFFLTLVPRPISFMVPAAERSRVFFSISVFLICLYVCDLSLRQVGWLPGCANQLIGIHFWIPLHARDTLRKVCLTHLMSKNAETKIPALSTPSMIFLNLWQLHPEMPDFYGSFVGRILCMKQLAMADKSCWLQSRSARPELDRVDVDSRPQWRLCQNLSWVVNLSSGPRLLLIGKL